MVLSLEVVVIIVAVDAIEDEGNSSNFDRPLSLTLTTFAILPPTLVGFPS